MYTRETYTKASEPVLFIQALEITQLAWSFRDAKVQSLLVILRVMLLVASMHWRPLIVYVFIVLGPTYWLVSKVFFGVTSSML